MSHTPKKFKTPRAKHNYQGRTCSITAVGSYVPSRILTNAELEKLVEQIEDENIQLDTLAGKVKAANELIKYCETRLRTIEDETMDLRK